MLKVEEKKLNLLNKLPSVVRLKGSYKKYIYVGITNDKSIKVVLIGFLILIFLKKRTNKTLDRYKKYRDLGDFIGKN